MSKSFYVTTPIYYVNDKPHIGHAYTTIVADLLCRFQRLAGRDAYFVTGTDEHGSKVAESARAAGLSERDFCDRTAQSFVNAWRNLAIENDYFIRTTSQRHEQSVLKLLNAMRGAKTEDGRDVIYSGYYEGLYCTGCEKFLTEKDLVDGVCPDHLRPPEKLREKNYFFRLTAYSDRIRRKIESGELCILPEGRRREVLGLINQGLPDFSLSRETVTWGIPLQFDPSQVAYVWVDALTNYISAVGYADDEDTFHKRWTEGEVVHLMAKDILKFHCLYWPAMLLAAGLRIPDNIFLHGFFTVDGQKLSKSVGVKIDPNDLVAQFGPDGARYLLLTQFPFGQDGDVQVSRFAAQYNSDLANDLGNLVSRVAKLIDTHFKGRLPEPLRDLGDLAPLQRQAESLADTASDHINEFRPGSVIDDAMSLVRATNKFFNDAAPWLLAKEGKKSRLGGVLYACCDVLRIVSVVLFPAMPNKMREIRSVLSLDDTSLSLREASRFFGLASGVSIRLTQPVFPRLKIKEPSAEVSPRSDNNLLDISEFGRVELRVAVVLGAEKVAGTDKLLRLQIDLGDERRQIVAGVAQHYSPAEITGKRIVVVTNLKPAKIRGVESHGMLLAAESKGTLTLVVPEGDLPAGAKIS